MEEPNSATVYSSGSRPSGEPAQAGGAQIGRFIVLKALGQGGMGVVYAAYDPGLDRKVALKLLHPERKRKSYSGGQARLLREAQAMARVDHPNVCKIFEVGTHGDQVFLAMEFIEGGTLQEWLHKGRSWRQVLEIFLQAGQGLAAAHAVGLVHRDFKPANVLVSKGGRAYVTDFGLARLVDEPPSLQTPSDKGRLAEGSSQEPVSDSSMLGLAVTQSGTVVGTPNYMPPEQHVGGALDARSDQFSFCAALYWALYKQRPFEPKQLATAASGLSRRSSGALASGPVAEALGEEFIREPPRNPQVPAWVRRAVLRGLSLYPEQRFASMQELLGALGQEPRRAQRRRALAVGSLLVAGLAAVAVPLYQQSRVCEEAERGLDGVWGAEVRQRLTTAFTATGRPSAQQAAAQASQVLDSYAQAWVQQSTHACRATRVDRSQTEELLSLQVVCLEQRRRDLQALVQVLTQEVDGKVVLRALDAALALPAVEECRDVASLSQQPRLPADAVRRAEVAQLADRLAEARALFLAGRVSPALERIQQLQPQIMDTAWLPLQAEAHLGLGKVLQRMGNLEASTAQFERALDIAEEARDDRLRARLLNDLTYDRGLQGNAELSELWARRAQAVLARLGREPLLASSLEGNLGMVALTQARHEDARRHFERQRSLQLQVLEPGNPRLIGSLYNLGLVAVKLGDLEQAVRLLGEALQQTEAVRGNAHPEVADAHRALAMALYERKEFSQALTHAQQAAHIRQVAVGEEHPLVGDALDVVGMTLLGLERYEEAQREFLRAIELKERGWGMEDVSLSYSYDGVGQALLAAGRAREAVVPLERALSFKGVEPDGLAESGYALARALWEVGQRSRAREVLAQARSRFAQVGKRDKVAAVDSWLASAEAAARSERKAGKAARPARNGGRRTR